MTQPIIQLFFDLFRRVIIIVTLINAIAFYVLLSNRRTLTVWFAVAVTALTLIVISISFAYDYWRFILQA